MSGVVLVPKNSGLAAQAKRALEMCSGLETRSVTFVRGEDVPDLANRISRHGRNVYAITGDDLLDEWLAGGNALSDRLQRARIAWEDSNAIFGKPALCAIGKQPLTPESTRGARIAYCARYENLAIAYLNNLEQHGIRLERIRVSGALESFLKYDIADFMIDIVVTGRTIREAGLSVQEIIYTSDLAVLESK